MNFTKSTISLLFVVSLNNIACNASESHSSRGALTPSSSRSPNTGFIQPSQHSIVKQSSSSSPNNDSSCTSSNTIPFPSSNNHNCPQTLNQSQRQPVQKQPLNFMKNLYDMNTFTPISTSDNTPSSSDTQIESRSKTQLHMAPPIPTLDNWSISKTGEATGRVSNHPSPNISDGEMVTTSKLRNYNRIQAKQGSTVTTASGSKYKLGKPKFAGTASPSVSLFRIGGGSNNLGSNTSAGAAEKDNAKPKAKPSWGFTSFQSNKSNSLNNNRKEDTKLEGPLVDEWFFSFRGELIGVITGHPSKDIVDGDTVTTSKITNDRKSLKDGDVVVTVNGSKYVLGKKRRGLPTVMFQQTGIGVSSGSNNLSRTFGLLNKQLTNAITNIQTTSSSKTGGPRMNNPSKEQVEKERLKFLREKYGINGKTLANGKYLLCGKARRSTSGKSNIWSAYKSDESGMPVGDMLTIKVSTNFDAMTREEKNYNRVCSGLFPGRFVEKAEFLQECNGSPSREFETSCALVIENGRKDLRAILNERGGRGFEGRAMRDAASAALQCVQAMHSSGIVWTDLKTENFVIVSDEIGDNGTLPGVKGIDLESAIPRGKNPVDFSPEACPPEFASAFIVGQGLTFKLDYSYDIWSYGMMLYELTTGKPYFDNKSPAQITMSLQYAFTPDLSDVKDDKLRDLIRLCLQYEPKKRPGVTQLLLHPYFLSTGIGPFGF